MYTHSLVTTWQILQPEQSCHSVMEEIPAKVRASSGFFPSRIATAYAPVKQSPAPVVSTTCMIEQPLLHHPELPFFATHCPMLYDRQHAWIATLATLERATLLPSFYLVCLEDWLHHFVAILVYQQGPLRASFHQHTADPLAYNVPGGCFCFLL